MHERGKYIAGEINGVGCAICFAETVPHDSFLGVFSEIWSAGFFALEESGEGLRGFSPVCYGESTGLGVESEPERDARLVKKALGLKP